MNKPDALKICRRIQEDTDMLSRFLKNTVKDREMITGQEKRFFESSLLASISNLETFDSYIGTFERIGPSVDKYVAIRQIVSNSSPIVVPS